MVVCFPEKIEYIYIYMLYNKAFLHVLCADIVSKSGDAAGAATALLLLQQ